MRSKVLLAGCALLAALSGCSTTGVQVSDAQAQQFTVGRSTIADVEAKLGNPTGSSSNSDGTRVISYKQNKNQSDPLAFVPIAGAFSYGSKTNTHEVIFIFNRNGTLMSYHTDDRTS